MFASGKWADETPLTESNGVAMVLGSAQYKRQHDYEAADSPAGGGGIIIGGNDDDARIVHSERELFMANQVG